MSLKLFLVEIRLKDWQPDLKSGCRILGYEEVKSYSSNNAYSKDEYAEKCSAQHKGFAQFCERAKYEPKIRKMLEENGLTVSANCFCAPDAVEI